MSYKPGRAKNYHEKKKKLPKKTYTLSMKTNNKKISDLGS